MFRLMSALPAAAIAIVAAVAIAACGSNSPRSSSSGGQVTFAQAQQDAVNFSGCMRSHGVPSFPDPTSPHEFKESMSPGSAVARSPAFQSAVTACEHLLPGGGPHHPAAPSQARIAAGRAFARCMRSHGFLSFPDPSSSGELSAGGIDIHQPAFLRAADACVSTTHGQLTKADVASYVAGH